MSSADRGRKIAVTDRQYLWVADDDKGEVVLHVGPTMVDLGSAERIVEDDGSGGYKKSNYPVLQDAPQKMIEIRDNQYAVMFNPLVADKRGVDTPNGEFRQGRNEPQPLENGTKQMIPGPCCFYLRPGQRCEVREAHKLNSDQYLVVEVYSDNVDPAAPYFDTTLRSAEITTFTDDTTSEPVPSETNAENPKVPVKNVFADDRSRGLIRGQLIVIRGLDTQFYIPPSGVDIVPDTSADATGAAISGEKAKEIISQALMSSVTEETEDEEDANEASAVSLDDEFLGPGMADVERTLSAGSVQAALPLEALSENVSGSVKKRPKRRRSRNARAGAGAVDQAARRRQRVQQDAHQYGQLVSNLQSNPQLRDELERQAAQSRLVRQAVVLREKEFCVVVDADGVRNIRQGPARVFPGPNDRFQVEGSRNRVYDAFELLPQRALWLRVVKEISRNELNRRLPRNFQLDQETYYPGDEIFLQGVSGFFFPFNEIEVLSPESGIAYIGNDHRQVFVEAIGIDQKSGIYVRDLETGEAKLIKGKCSYLVHPAKEVHISRTVASDDWNQWITYGCPFKRTDTPVVTPWALSIQVDHGMACMATSAVGQRVIVGPCVELLEYEETLAHLRLSTRKQEKKKKTCFLRIVGNRVGDVIRIQTSDFVQIDVDVRFGVTFEEEHKNLWFNHKNYVQVLTEHARSLVRNRCRSMGLSELWPQIPNILRDVVLGVKGEDGNRPGRFFKENGMRITEVEILDSRILDPEIAEQFNSVQREIVQLQIGDHHEQAKLTSTRLRSKLEIEQGNLKKETEEQRSSLDSLLRELRQRASVDSAEKDASLQMLRQRTEDQREIVALQSQLERRAQKHQAELAHVKTCAEVEAEATRTRDSAVLETEKQRSDFQQSMLAAEANADVERNKSVQPGLVEAITALGDKQMLTTAAENMNLVSLVKGDGVVSLLSKVLGSTRVANTLRAMTDKFSGKQKGARPIRQD